MRLHCHLKIDTGMNRLGFRHDNLARTLPEVAASANLEIDAVYTHFATADNPEHPAFGEQRERFDAGRCGAAGRSACRRAGTARGQQRRAAGAMSASGSITSGQVCCSTASFRRRCTRPSTLRPALSLTSRIVAVKGLRPGEATRLRTQDRPSIVPPRSPSCQRDTPTAWTSGLPDAA